MDALAGRIVETEEDRSAAVIERLIDPAEIAAALSVQRARLRAAGMPESYAETGDVFVDQYVRVSRDAVRFPNGETGTYIRIGGGTADGGGVIAVPRLGGRYVFVRQWRHATGRAHLEFPRGIVELGEAPAAAAAREIREEIGGNVVAIERIGATYADTGLLERPTEVYAVEVDDALVVPGGEPIQAVETMAAGEVLAAVAGGRIDDGLTMAAFLIEQAWRRAAGGGR